MPFCKEHQENPIKGYSTCAACEIEMLRKENEEMKALIQSSNFWETCKQCGAQFIPGGKDVTDKCATCYKEKSDSLQSLVRTSNKIIHDMTVRQQSALIEYAHGDGVDGMVKWIEEGLFGPGHIPDYDSANGKNAQAWWDANCHDAVKTG